MYLYRVEHKTDCTGPYQKGITFDKDHLYRMEDHPSPYDEGLDFFFGDHCGFESKKKLLDWFTLEDLKDFEKEGLYVYKIHTEIVEKGEKQLIFDPSLSYYRRRIPLKDLRRYASFGYCDRQQPIQVGCIEE